MHERDSKASKRKKLATIEMQRMLDRYEDECKSLSTRKMTQEEIDNMGKKPKKYEWNPLKKGIN